MDFTKPIAYNALSINTVTTTSGGRPASGYQVEGLDIFPTNARQYIEDKALQDGGQASDVYLKPQPMQLIVSVFGSTAGDYWDKVQDLRYAFNPRIAYEADTAALGFLPLTFYQPTADIATWPVSAYPNGIPMQYEVRPSGRIGEANRRDAVGGLSGRGLAGRFVIPLLAISPYKVGQSYRTADIASPSFTTAQVATLALKGDYYAWPLFTIGRGGAGTATVTTFTIKYGTVTMAVTSYTMTGSTNIYIDPRTRRIYTSLGANLASYLTVTGDWQPMAATGATITTTVTSAASNTEFTVRAKDTFT